MDQLIPQALRAFEPSEYADSSEETIWFNPTEKDATLDLYIGTPTPRGKQFPPRNWEDLTGKRRYIIRAGQTRSMPAEFDRAIQHTHCKDGECLVRPYECKNPLHTDKEIVGGLGPQLRNMGTQKRPITVPARLHPSLDDVAAREKALKEKRFEIYERGEQASADEQRSRAALDKINHELEERKAQLAAADAALAAASAKAAKTAKSTTAAAVDKPNE
jgi:hypothetical protein